VTGAGCSGTAFRDWDEGGGSEGGGSGGEGGEGGGGKSRSSRAPSANIIRSRITGTSRAITISITVPPDGAVGTAAAYRQLFRLSVRPTGGRRTPEAGGV
jgi:hypothetical protein